MVHSIPYLLWLLPYHHPVPLGSGCPIIDLTTYPMGVQVEAPDTYLDVAILVGQHLLDGGIEHASHSVTDFEILNVVYLRK
jgi:hypothetical protein